MTWRLTGPRSRTSWPSFRVSSKSPAEYLLTTRGGCLGENVPDARACTVVVVVTSVATGSGAFAWLVGGSKAILPGRESAPPPPFEMTKKAMTAAATSPIVHPHGPRCWLFTGGGRDGVARRDEAGCRGWCEADEQYSCVTLQLPCEPVRYPWYAPTRLPHFVQLPGYRFFLATIRNTLWVESPSISLTCRSRGDHPQSTILRQLAQTTSDEVCDDVGDALQPGAGFPYCRCAPARPGDAPNLIPRTSLSSHVVPRALPRAA